MTAKLEAALAVKLEQNAFLRGHLGSFAGIFYELATQKIFNKIAVTVGKLRNLGTYWQVLSDGVKQRAIGIEPT